MRKTSTGFLALAAISLLTFGCSEDKPGGGATGSGGSASGSGGSASGSGGSASGSGGSASGSGGSASGSGGSGGSASGSGGATGSGGMVGTDGGTDGPAGCIAPTAATGLVSDFATTMATGMLQTGGTDTWKSYPAGATSTAVVAAGEMHAESPGPWASLSVSVAGFGTCVNLGKYVGVKFKVRSPTNTSMLFLVATRETELESNHYRKMFTLTPTATEVMIPFADLTMAPFGTNPPAGFKPHERAYALAFGVLAMTEKLDIFLDDVTFY